MDRKGGKKVFFAGVSPEMVKYRDNLIAELEHFGCEIVQLDANSTVDSLIGTLEQCHIAIHILSDNDFAIGQNKKGLEEEQLTLSVSHCVGRKLTASGEDERFKVFAWHPKPVTESIYQEEKLSAHLRRVQQMEEAEFLRTTFEDFKYYLLRQIEVSKDYAHDVHFIKDDPNLSVFFLYDTIDKQEAAQYLDFLKRRGFSVFSPKLDGDIMLARQTYNTSLKLFDVAIIFAPKAGANWINMKLMDILKSPGMGREKEIRAKVVMIPSEKVGQCPLIARGFDVLEVDASGINSSLELYLKNISSD